MKCERCDAEWADGGACYACQELDIITALDEHQFTEKLRKQFSEPIKVGRPDVIRTLPWSAEGSTLLSKENRIVGKFVNDRDCVFAAKSSSAYHDLVLLAAVVHERIRVGRSFYVGSDSDVALWLRVRDLTK